MYAKVIAGAIIHFIVIVVSRKKLHLNAYKKRKKLKPYNKNSSHHLAMLQVLTREPTLSGGYNQADRSSRDGRRRSDAYKRGKYKTNINKNTTETTKTQQKNSKTPPPPWVSHATPKYAANHS